MNRYKVISSSCNGGHSFKIGSIVTLERASSCGIDDRRVFINSYGEEQWLTVGKECILLNTIYLGGE